MYLKKYFFALIVFSITGCQYSQRNIKISYHVNEVPGIKPSYQTAIWLQTPDGKYVKTLFVSEYLSFGGFTLPGICPDWSGKSDWSKTTQEEFDAVTGATPSSGDNCFEYSCTPDEVPDGDYEYLIEVHLQENYNELYKGKIRIGKESMADPPVVVSKPNKLIGQGNILSDIQIKVK